MNNGFEKIELSYEAIGKILKSSEVMNVCKSYSNKYGDTTREFVGFDRCHVFVLQEDNK